jgi:hypothetical protein
MGLCGRIVTIIIIFLLALVISRSILIILICSFLQTSKPCSSLFPTFIKSVGKSFLQDFFAFVSLQYTKFTDHRMIYVVHGKSQYSAKAANTFFWFPCITKSGDNCNGPLREGVLEVGMDANGSVSL